MIGQAWHVARRRNGRSLPGRLIGHKTTQPTGALPLRTATTAARRSGPREHGRQAARSKRSRTGQAREKTTQTSHARAGAACALISIEAYSATSRTGHAE